MRETKKVNQETVFTGGGKQLMNAYMKELFTGNPPYFLHTMIFPKDLSIVVLAPHPDDFDTIGFMLRCLKENGNPIHVAMVTSGAGGVEDSFCSPPTWEVKSEVREEEQRQSCRFFGLPETHLTFLRLPEDSMGHPLADRKNLECIRQYLLEKTPDMVFLTHGNDTNTGHQRTYAMFREIVAAGDFATTAFLFRDPKTIAMRHDLYAVFGEKEAEWKAQLLRFHQSQHQRNLNTRNYGFDERILRMNRQTAQEFLQSDLYAEVFELEFWNQE